MNVRPVQTPIPPSASPEPSVGMEGVVEAALLRLEDDAEARRSLARRERRHALDGKLEAIQKAKKSSRTKMIAGLVSNTVNLAASAASGVAGASGEEGNATARIVEGLSKAAKLGAELANEGLTHKSNVQKLDSEAMSAGAEGLSGVAKEHADASDGSARAAERVKAHLSRILEGQHAQRMAAVRG